MSAESSPGRSLRIRVIATLLGSGWVLSTLTGVTPAGAQSGALRAGDVQIVTTTDTSRQIAEGGSSTVFTLKLPDGAVCPGDSANDGYRIQSFLVPAADDPGAIVYRSIGPSGAGQIALYGVDTNQFVQALTQKNDAPGQPGVVPPLPPLTFGVYAPTDLEPGPHRMGVACSLINETTRYWDTEVEITRDAADEPAQVHWVVTDAATSSSGSTSGTTTFVVLAAVVVMVLGGGAYLLSRRLRPATGTPTKEPR